MKKERRYKLVCIGEEEIMTAMTSLTDAAHNHVVLPTFAGIPEGHEIIAVNYDFSRQSFAFLIWHESFPIVPQWETFEVIDPRMECHEFDVGMIRRWAKANPR